MSEFKNIKNRIIRKITSYLDNAIISYSQREEINDYFNENEKIDDEKSTLVSIYNPIDGSTLPISVKSNLENVVDDMKGVIGHLMIFPLEDKSVFILPVGYLDKCTITLQEYEREENKKETGKILKLKKGNQ